MTEAYEFLQHSTKCVVGDWQRNYKLIIKLTFFQLQTMVINMRKEEKIMVVDPTIKIPVQEIQPCRRIDMVWTRDLDPGEVDFQEKT